MEQRVATSVGEPTAAVRPAVLKRWLRLSLAINVKGLLREPLVHFLLIGLALFAVYAALQRGPGHKGTSYLIELTEDDLRQLQIGFTAQWGRPPTKQEIAGLVKSKVREEILYREALALGLDKEDTIVKRRMAQKMEFLGEDVSNLREPRQEELRAWYEKNSQQFVLPSLVTFHHLYFSPDKRGAKAREDAAQVLRKIAGKAEESPATAKLADRFMFQDYYADRSREQLANVFGTNFAHSVFELKSGSWQGPIESGYGWHLIWIDAARSGRTPAFEEVEPEVKTAWLADQKAIEWEKAYAKMRAKYDVVAPQPPEEPTATQNSPTKQLTPTTSPRVAP
jgi:peptidyl-prolyl cis-trans isomerase C